jgi:hypothetical protein
MNVRMVWIGLVAMPQCSMSRIRPILQDLGACRTAATGKLRET